MKQFTSHVAGDPISIYVYQEGDDLAPFASFVAAQDYMGFDTETTGGSIWAPSWRPRLAQFGSGSESHVLPATMGRAIKAALGAGNLLVMHSAPADCITAARGWGIDPEPLAKRALDTLVLSRLIDPMGHSTRDNKNRLNSLHGLKDRTRQLVDPGYNADNALKEAARKQKTQWWSVDADTPEYLEYSALDPVITVRLLETLRYLGSSPLEAREHRLMVECMMMTWRGMRIDQEYRDQLETDMLAEAEASHKLARSQGFPADDIGTKVDKEAVAQWLESQGIDVPRTGKGAPSLAKEGLYMATAGTPVHAVLEKFYHARELHKWVRDYISKMAGDRVHPGIQSIGAITGRQSVSEPPFHQLPPAVRGCIVPDPGFVLGSVDLDRIEFCVAAGLSQDPTMMEAIKNGEDLHAITASRLYGADFTPEQRTIAKRAGFGRMYGGGAGTLALQCGIDEDTASSFIRAFDGAYPDTRKLSRRLGTKDWVTTAWGRNIPADPTRKYGNLNYCIQSTARDVFVDGMLKVIESGIQVLLPLHDEVIVQLPKDSAEEGLKKVIECMSGEFYGVPITAGGKLMDRWAK